MYTEFLNPMEAIAILFVIFVLYLLISDPPAPKKRSAGDNFADSLKDLVGYVCPGLCDKGGGDKGSSKKGASGPPWTIVVLAVVLGFLFTYVF